MSTLNPKDAALLAGMMKSKRRQALLRTPILTIGELINRLDTVYDAWREDKEKRDEPVVLFDFCSFSPTTLHSYRGSYDELAIGYGEHAEPPTVSKFLLTLNSAVGKEFTGYKGGKYVMDMETPIWVADISAATDTGVIGVTDTGYFTIINTQYIEKD